MPSEEADLDFATPVPPTHPRKSPAAHPRGGASKNVVELRGFEPLTLTLPA